MEPKVISGVKFSSLPSSYIRPESERPKLSEVEDCDNVPVIDLGCEDRSLIIKQIGDACQEYGFFQVISSIIFASHKLTTLRAPFTVLHLAVLV